MWVPVSRSEQEGWYKKSRRPVLRHRGVYKKYSDNALLQAVKMVLEEGFSVRKASVLTGVPASTLTDRLNKEKKGAGEAILNETIEGQETIIVVTSGSDSKQALQNSQKST